MNNSQSLYLAHHGILGQQWGKRNGPPYPLAPGKHSRSEKKAHWQNSLKSAQGIRFGENTGRSSSSNSADKKTDETKIDHKNVITDADREYLRKQLKDTRTSGRVIAALGTVTAVGCGVAATAFPPALIGSLYSMPVVSVGLISSADASQKLRADKRANKLAKKYEEERQNSPIDEKTGLRVKQTDMTIEEDAARVNPLFEDVTKQSKHNCYLCTVTYDMRRRGYDVTAKGAAVGYTDDEVSKWYGNKMDVKHLEKNEYAPVSPTMIMDALKKEGGRGMLCVYWKGGGGHAMAYDTEGGSLKIIDAQSNKILKTEKEIKRYLSYAVESEYARLDNLKINPKLMLQEAVNQ